MFIDSVTVFHALRHAGFDVALGSDKELRFVRPTFITQVGDIEEYNGVRYKCVRSWYPGDSYIEYVLMSALMTEL